MENSKQPTRPKGRTLVEFLNEKRELFPAEQKLLVSCAIGDPAEFAKALPDRMTEDNRIRAAFLRFLVLGGGGRPNWGLWHLQIAAYFTIHASRAVIKNIRLIGRNEEICSEVIRCLIP
jgi:hypothetical protein